MAFYIFHPKSSIALGFAYDDRNPADDMTQNGIFEWQNKDFKKAPIGAQIEYEMTEINDKKQFFEKTVLDFSAEAKFSLVSGDTSLKWEKELTFNENSLVYIFSAKKIYTDERALGVLKLSEYGQSQLNKLCNSNKIGEFLKQSGTDVVTKITRGNVISLTYMFSFSSRESKEKLKAHLGIAWQTGNANIDFEKYKRESDSSMRLYVKAYQANVNDLTPKDARITAIMDKNPGDLIEVKKILKNILDDISEPDRETAPIISFNTIPVYKIGQIVESKCSDTIDEYISANQRVNDECSNLRELLLETNFRLDIASRYSAVWNENSFEPGSKDVLDNTIIEYKRIKNKISDTYKQILRTKKASEISLTTIKIPILQYDTILKAPYIKLISWELTSTRSCSTETLEVRNKVYPKLKILYPEAINQIDLLQNDKKVISFFDFDINFILSKNGELVELWSNDYVGFRNCWGCREDLQKQYQESYIEQHKQQESTIQYVLKIYTRNNEVQTVSIGNIVNPSY